MALFIDGLIDPPLIINDVFVGVIIDSSTRCFNICYKFHFFYVNLGFGVAQICKQLGDPFPDLQRQ